MEQKAIIHRDLKPENILLNSGKQNVYDVRIADFGYAIMTAQVIEPEEYVCGTAGYIPLEALRGKGYNLKSDIFSIGGILYYLLTHKRLFYGNSEA